MTMKYRAGVWTTNSAEDMNDFFYHREDQRQLPPEEIPIYAPDHTDPIWDRKFQVEVPTIAVKSVETLARRGLVITGIKKVDDVAHERLIYPFLSINDIIEIENNGYDVNYTSLKDLIDIYNIVKDYIGFWNGVMNGKTEDVHSFSQFPVEDLSRIESYMHSIFPLVEKSVGEADNTWSSMLGRFMIVDDTVKTTPKLIDKDINVIKNQGLPNTLGEV